MGNISTVFSRCCGSKRNRVTNDIGRHQVAEPSPHDSVGEIEEPPYFSKEQEDYYAEQHKAEDVVPEVAIPVRWQSSKLLGSGSSGTVMKATNDDTGEIFAVKEIKLLGKEKAPGRIAAFETEVENLSKLRHPNIVGYLGSQKTDKFVYIFMEYTGKHSLRSQLKKKRSFDEAVLRDYARQVLKGLEYLHSHQVAHRDIKAANVLLTKDGVCKLADFGCSKQKINKDEASDFMSVKGTINWMAPEVMLRSGHGRRADIWSFGCLMVELATGNPPWSKCPTPFMVFRKVCHSEELPDVSMLPLTAQHFVLQCFKRNPAERPSVCDLLQHPFLVSHWSGHTSARSAEFSLSGRFSTGLTDSLGSFQFRAPLVRTLKEEEGSEAAA